MNSKKVFEPDNGPRILYMESDNEVSVANDSSDAEEDYLEEQLEVSNKEQEVSSEDEEYEDQIENIVFGKDKATKWTLKNPVHNIRTNTHSIVNEMPGIKGIAKHAKSGLACLSPFFDDDMLSIIVNNTNKLINSKKELYQQQRDCKTTDLAEIKTFIGLLYMAGHHRNSRLNTKIFIILMGLVSNYFD